MMTAVTVFTLFNLLPVNLTLKPDMSSVFLTRKSHGGQLEIGWLAGAATGQPVTNHPPRDFRVRKTLLITG